MPDGSKEETNNPEEVKQVVSEYWQGIWNNSHQDPGGDKPWWSKVNQDELKESENLTQNCDTTYNESEENNSIDGLEKRLVVLTKFLLK